MTDRHDAIEQIKKLKYRYWRACDAKDPQGFRECFLTSGAKVDYGALGSFDDVGPMVAIYEQVALRRHADGGYVLLEAHHGFMGDITLESETDAVGTWSLRYRCIDRENLTDTVSVGTYDDRYTIEDGRWKMAASRFVISWSVTQPLSDAAQITSLLS